MRPNRPSRRRKHPPTRSPGPIPLIQGLTDIVRMCSESPDTTRNPDHAPPHNAKPWHIAREGLAHAAFKPMSEFGIHALTNAGLAGRFTTTRCGPFRQPDTSSEPADATKPGLTGFNGNSMPTAVNGVDLPDEILRSAIRVGRQEPGAILPTTVHRFRPEPHIGCRDLRAVEGSPNGAPAPERKASFR